MLSFERIAHVTSHLEGLRTGGPISSASRAQSCKHTTYIQVNTTQLKSSGSGTCHPHAHAHGGCRTNPRPSKRICCKEGHSVPLLLSPRESWSQPSAYNSSILTVVCLVLTLASGKTNCLGLLMHYEWRQFGDVGDMSCGSQPGIVMVSSWGPCSKDQN